MAFEIPSGIFNSYNKVADELINNQFIGVDCRVIYPESRVTCPNCIWDSFNQKSSGKYKSGGPIAFTAGQCPYCHGEGYKLVENTDTLRLRVYWSRKDWRKIAGSTIDLPDGDVMTIGFKSDLAKCQQAKYLIVDTDNEEYRKWRFTAASEPTPHGFGNRYFWMTWNRNG